MEDSNATQLPQSRGFEEDQSNQNPEGTPAPANANEATPAESRIKLAPLDNDSEDEEQLNENNRHATYESLGKDVLERERRLGRLHLRSQQATLHNNLSNMRLEDVERELRSLKATVMNLGEDSIVRKKLQEKLPIQLHEIRRVNVDESQLSFDVVTLPSKQQPALEVLFNENALFTTSSSGGQIDETGPGIKAKPPIATTDHSGLSVASQSGTPEKLRIRSRQLLWHLQTLKGGSFFWMTGPRELKDLKVHSALVFLRPFKFFVESHTAIKESLEDVEAEAAKAFCGDEDKEYRQADEEKDAERPRFDVQDLLQDLRLLIEFLDVDLKPTLDLRRSIKEGTATEIEYADLWHLFERGTYAVTQGNADHAYMVINIAGGREPLVDRIPYDDEEGPSHAEEFVVDCLSIGMNGKSYVPKLAKFPIRKYHGSQSISSLPIYPLQLAQDCDRLRSAFLERGKNFFNITRKPFSHHTIQGKTLDEPSHEVDAQAIVDMTLATAAKPDWRLSERITACDLSERDKRETYTFSWCKHMPGREGCCGGDVIFKDLASDTLETESFIRRKGRLLGPVDGMHVENDDFILMRPYVHAFILRSRQWVTVQVEDLHEVEFENRLNDLVLPDGHKTTVRALVTTHENSRASHSNASGSSISRALDLVKGKGSGLVILLHGPPGVGKTSTAECVADDTKRPLYPITCGDIGETAAEVESNLQRNFQLAHKWGCVLLLDEADIFLAKRTKHDLRHNAVTSVFLRSLEYYAGILFLTTNRVGTIDPAFKSRIQMSLFYPKLSLDVTLSLYEKFIKRARMEQDRTQIYIFKIKEKEILKFAKRHFRELDKHGYDTWNGRQIRNAFQTAIALVEHESLKNADDIPRPVLGKSQFETVATGFKKFDEYLNTTLGVKESVAAKHDLWRDDSFTLAGTESTSTMRTPPGAMSRRAYDHHGTQSRTPATRQFGSDEEMQSDSDSDSDFDEDVPKRPKQKQSDNDGAARSSRVVISDTEVGSADQLEEEFRRFIAFRKSSDRKP